MSRAPMPQRETAAVGDGGPCEAAEMAAATGTDPNSVDIHRI